ncbi:MAG: class I SAM-dependent methyltransferase [Crocinitomicaceae bacterium]|nr:class I SAM-dependent methyltransferase [Crocinitomicaceae bacterium]
MPSKLSKKELNDIIQWDVKTWSKALDFWEKYITLKPGMSVLTIGEREGGLSLWLAQKGLEVTCTDYKEFPDTTASMHNEYGVSANIKCESGVDVTDLSRYSDEQFDVVVFKSVIGALSEKERQQQAINEIRRVLKPGGSLLFAENLIGTRLHVALRKRFIRWNTYWRYLHVKKDMDLFEGFSKKFFETKGFAANFGRSEAQRRFLATIDGVVVWLLPKSWRYVLFGVLIK